MRKGICCLALGVWVGGLLLVWTSFLFAAPAKPTEIRAVVWMTPGRSLTKNVETVFVDMVKQRSNGELVINLVGGPEVIPKPEQVQACSDGIIDMAFAVCGEYRQVIPEVAALHLSPTTPWEDRKNGIYDYWLDLHKKYNLYYLGRWSYNVNYVFYLKRPIKNLAGFKVLKISPTGRTDKLIEALGAVNVEVGGRELYSAMEKGLIDGYVWSDSGLLSSWKEVTKCVVDHPILSAATFTTVMNLKKFNSLSKQQQEALTSAAADYEPIMAKYFSDLKAKEQKEWREAGVSFVKLPPEEAKWLNEHAAKLAWEMVKTTLSSEAYGKLRKGMLMD